MDKNYTGTEVLPIDLLISGFRNALINKKIVGTVVALATIAAFAISFYSPKKYASDVTLSISGAISTDSSLVDSNRAAGAAAAKAYLNTQYELLMSRDMFVEVYEKAKGSSCDQASYSDAAPGNAFQFDPEKHIKVNPVRNTDLISIQAICSNPEAARDLAELYAREFIEHKIKEFQTERARVTEWRKQELARLKTILEQSEAELQAYRESQGVYSSQKNSERNDAEIERLLASLSEQENNRLRLSSLKTQLSLADEDFSVDNILSIASLKEDPTLEFLVMEISKLSTSLNANKKLYQEEHPIIKEDQIRYDETLGQIRTRIEVSSRSLDKEIQLLDASIWRVRRDLKELTSNTLVSNPKVSTLATLEQSVEMNQGAYRSFVEQTNSVLLSLGFVGDQIKIVGRAFVNSKPVSPNIKKNAILAFVLSLFCSTLFFVVRGALDPTFKHSDDVKTRLNSATLGYLPEVRSNTSELAFSGYNTEKDNIFAESVRSLRTSLKLVDIGAKKKVTVITSSVPHEGKSTVAMNLAAACGQVEKVLLIDSDIRRETLSRSLNVKDGQLGLVNIFGGEKTAEDCIVSDASKFYKFLPAGRYSSGVEEGVEEKEGSVPHSSLELLSVEKFEELVNELSEEYDHIIIDCPPVCGISDAKIVATCATRLIYVIAAFQTPTKVVQHCFRELQSSNIEITGVVLNKVDIAKAHAYTSVGYYSYSYNSPEKKLS